MGSPEQADELRASLHPAETEASLVQKPTPPPNSGHPVPPRCPAQSAVVRGGEPQEPCPGLQPKDLQRAELPASREGAWATNW